VGDGEVCALRLSDDLTSAIGQPQLLFRASEASWAREINSKNRRGYVTEGPSMHRLASGELLMLWSSFGAGGYAVGSARSASGNILGPWIQQPQPLYSGDGGHCVVFRAFDGQLWLTFHRPNPTTDERPQFIRLRENASSLEIV
jgi:arabinan endo-1,5-alpha-L-arabinosidase